MVRTWQWLGLPGSQVQSLVEELISHKPNHLAKKEKKKRKSVYCEAIDYEFFSSSDFIVLSGQWYPVTRIK